MLKKSCAALAVLSAVFAGAASAADVQVYGRVDTGLYLTKSDATGVRSLSMESGIAGASRFGFMGSETLGNGVKVGFVLENGFSADTGVMAGSDDSRLFDRDSYLYANTPYGDFRFGRSGSLGGGVSGGLFAGTISPFGVVYKEAASTKVFAVEGRLDNMVRYDTPSFGGLKLSAQYSNGIDGDDALNNSQKDRYAAFGATYTIGGLKLVGVVDKYLYNDRKYHKTDDKNGKKGIGNKTAYKLGLQYKASEGVTLYGGYQHTDNAQKIGLVTADAVKGADTDAFTVGTRIALGGGNLNLALGYVEGDKRDGSNLYEVKMWQAAIGYTYPLSKRTVLYTAAAYLDSDYTKDGAAVKGTKKDTTSATKVKSLMAGIYHSF